jgi:hypothetical protein
MNHDVERSLNVLIDEAVVAFELSLWLRRHQMVNPLS